MTDDQIRVDVPPSTDAARDRVEREVFTRLAALRSMDRSRAARATTAPPRGRLRFAMASAAIAALAIAIIVLVMRKPHNASPESGPSLVVTPVDGSSRFTVGDAIVDAGSDTSVEVKTVADGVTLVLQRGSIDCDVAPRNGRPPFRVVSGDVSVEVIGTRFSVTRTGAQTRVDVTHGRVRVRAPVGERYLTAGESWTPPLLTEVAPQREETPTVEATADEAPPVPTPTPAPTPTPTPTRPAQTPRAAFAAAQTLEARDPEGAAKAYRVIANRNDAWAALALYSLAELHTLREPTLALRDLDELARRFPNGANAEDAAWLRVDVLRQSGRTSEAKSASAEYLKKFPQGTYAKAAAQLSSPR